MSVTVTTFVQDGKSKKSMETHTHTLAHFPNYSDMITICKRDNIRATDFEHRYRNEDGTFFVGRFITTQNWCDVAKGRRGLRFFIRCDSTPTYKELVR